MGMRKVPEGTVTTQQELSPNGGSLTARAALASTRYRTRLVKFMVGVER
jgi:hypothetical protein